MPAPTHTAGAAVFLSYAREDSAAAQRIADALRAFGIEVWFDQAELRGGDTWDQKIRGQIKTCMLFVPIVSAQTEARSEGYFRREWKLAVDRSHDMAAGRAFIVPVVIDDTKESSAAVPEEFMRYQWTRLVGGVPSPEFVAQVKRLLDMPAKAGAAAAAVRPAGPAPANAAAPAPASRRLVVGIAVGAGLAAVFALVFALRREAPPALAGAGAHPPPSEKTAAPAVAAERSVAVLAFADLSAAKDSEYLSDGISEEVLNVLAKVPDLRVAARTSAFFYKGKNLPISEIAAKLNVAYVVEGSVQRAGERVKITAQLIKAADGFHLWSDTFTRDLKDVFAVQEEIAGLIAGKLSQQLGVRAATAGPAAARTATLKSPAAYEAFLRGRAAQTSGYSERTIADAIRYYEAALRLDPDYALAWARLAECYARIASSGYDRSAELLAKGRGAAAQALRLDPGLPETQLAQARCLLAFDRDAEAAGRALDLVERLRPGEVAVPAVRVAIAYAAGRWGDALAGLIARAVEADPQNLDNLTAMAVILTNIGRFADAERLCERAAAAGESGEESIRQKHVNLYAWTGDAAAALALLETMPVELRENNGRFYFSRAQYRLRLGDTPGAIADFERSRAITVEQFARRSGPRGVAVQALYRLARVEAARGSAARAALLEQELQKEVEAFRREFPENTGVGASTVAIVFARRGRAAEALRLVDENIGRAAVARDLGGELSARRARAAVLAALGRADEAIGELRTVFAAGYGFGYALRNNDELESLHPDPRFQKLMAEAEALANAQPRKRGK